MATLTHSLDVLSDGNVRPSPAVPGSDPLTDYYFILHDDPVRDIVLQKNRAYPETVPLRNSDGMKLDEQVQWILFRECVRACFGDTDWRRHLDTRNKKAEFVHAFINLYDGNTAFCNGTGIDTNRCWVEEVVLRAAQRSGVARQIPILTGGNVVKRIMTGPQVVGFIQIETWNGVAIPTARNILHAATQVYPDGRVEAFPQLVKFGAVNVPYVVPSTSPQYIAADRVRQLRESELFPGVYRGRL